MENRALVNKVFTAMGPITNSLEEGINTMDKRLHTLSVKEKQLYLLSILKNTDKFNDVIKKFAKKLIPAASASKRRSTMKGGMHRGQLVRHQPQQLAHRFPQHQPRHLAHVRPHVNTRRARDRPRFNQWAAKPLYVVGGGIALGVIIYKFILPLIFKKTPGAVARVSGKLAEAVAIGVAQGISWTSAKTTSAIKPLASFFDYGVKEIQFYQPLLLNARGNPYPQYAPVTGTVEGWPEGENYEAYTAPRPSGWFSSSPPPLVPDLSLQVSRIIPPAYVEPMVDPPSVRYLSNAVRNMKLPQTLGNAIEDLLESAIDDEIRYTFFILSIIGGICLTGAVLILLDRHRAHIGVQILNIEQRQAELEHRDNLDNGPDPEIQRQLDLQEARLQGQLEVYQQLLRLNGAPLNPAIQGIQAGIQLANVPAPPLLGNAQAQHQEELNE